MVDFDGNITNPYFMNFITNPYFMNFISLYVDSELEWVPKNLLGYQLVS